jgi:hypothetical protein
VSLLKLQPQVHKWLPCPQSATATGVAITTRIDAAAGRVKVEHDDAAMLVRIDLKARRLVCDVLRRSSPTDDLLRQLHSALGIFLGQSVTLVAFASALWGYTN